MDAPVSPTRPDLPLWRLHVLRAFYLFIAAGLAVTYWPTMVSVEPGLELYRTVTRGVLVTVSLLALLGIRYPVKMLPLLLFELIWKVIWLGNFWLRLWADGPTTPAIDETWFACLMGVVLTPLALPWTHLWREYVRAPGDRWRRTAPDQS